MECPYCKKHYKMYAVFMSHLEHHGCTLEEAKNIYNKLKEEIEFSETIKYSEKIDELEKRKESDQ